MAVVRVFKDLEVQVGVEPTEAVLQTATSPVGLWTLVREVGFEPTLGSF